MEQASAAKQQPEQEPDCGDVKGPPAKRPKKSGADSAALYAECVGKLPKLSQQLSEWVASGIYETFCVGVGEVGYNEARAFELVCRQMAQGSFHGDESDKSRKHGSKGELIDRK